MKAKVLKQSVLLGIFLLGLSACGGSSSSSPTSTNTTAVSGKLNSASASNASQNASLNMSLRENLAVSGINVVGTDETGSTTTASTDDTGSFTIDLPVGHTYVVSFFSGQTLLGILSFSIDQAGTFDTTAFRLNSGDDSLSLGNIICTAGACSGDVNPLCSLDRDDDGSVDCEDADDDNDSVDDVDENDRDHDGIDDDLEDGEESDDDVASNDCEVIRSRPYDGEVGVDQDEEIKVRFSNALNVDTVTSESLYLSDVSGLIVASITFENEDEHGEARLNPASNLAPITEYTLHVSSSIQCNNGQSPSQNLEVSFTTDSNN